MVESVGNKAGSSLAARSPAPCRSTATEPPPPSRTRSFASFYTARKRPETKEAEAAARGEEDDSPNSRLRSSFC